MRRGDITENSRRARHKPTAPNGCRHMKRRRHAWNLPRFHDARRFLLPRHDAGVAALLRAERGRGGGRRRRALRSAGPAVPLGRGAGRADRARLLLRAGHVRGAPIQYFLNFVVCL